MDLELQAKRRRLGPDDSSGAVPVSSQHPRRVHQLHPPAPELHPNLQLHPHQQLSGRPGLHPPLPGQQPPPEPQQPPKLLRPKAAASQPRSVPPSGHTYKTECILGKGSFGTVCKVTVVETGQAVAIKTVKLRESAREVDALHQLRGCPNVVTLFGLFEGAEVRAEDRTLNLVMEFMADTLGRIIKHHRGQGTWMDLHFVRVYMYQLLRGLASLSRNGVVHRDIKPANLLVDPETHTLKVCDFGTSKMLQQSEASQPYVCSRYYRAPELILSALEQTIAVDMWSAGCVLAEMLIHQPVFPGKDGVDQLHQIFEILGTPTAMELHAMNPQYDAAVGFGPHIEPVPWTRVLRSRADPEVVRFLSEILQYDPSARPQPIVAMASQMFDDLRRNPNSVDCDLFDFNQEELVSCMPELQNRLMPWR